MFKYIEGSKNGEACSGDMQICCMGLLQTIAMGKYTINGIAGEYPSIDDMDSGYKMNYCPVCGERLMPKEIENKRWEKRMAELDEKPQLWWL